MADKQQILSLALDDLITGLTNPPCLDSNGKYVSRPGGDMPCPAGSARQFEPVRDMHVGVVSSSLGGHGSDACAADTLDKATNNDRAHLLDRKDPQTGDKVPTYQGLGFLAWDPAQALVPPGQSDSNAMVQSFKDMVLGVGQIGCGYEAQLESWYRFLVDPDPVETIAVDQNGSVVLQGTDSVLLAQRKAFLRPDSMLVIVMLTDENDCSIKEQGQYYLVAQQKGPGGAPFHLPKPRAICATDPNDPCCASCGQATPPGCAVDPSCTDGNGELISLDELGDNVNLRCFEQKRRFGIDFLYPADRYVSALTSKTVTDRSGQVVPNPIFSDLDPKGGITAVRDPGLVLFTGIVGVPWQDIAKNPNDLTQGFKTAGELTQKNAKGQTTWDIILGDPGAGVPPADPFMLESITPRAGVTPGNPINGHEWTISKNDDLQYACIMPIPMARDCSNPNFQACDCVDTLNDNPLCETSPGGQKTLQTKAKAYPGLRQLAVLRGLGSRAVIGSICADQITDPTLPDYGYRPVMSSMIDLMKGRL